MCTRFVYKSLDLSQSDIDVSPRRPARGSLSPRPVECRLCAHYAEHTMASFTHDIARWTTSSIQTSHNMERQCRLLPKSMDHNRAQQVRRWTASHPTHPRITLTVGRTMGPPGIPHRYVPPLLVCLPSNTPPSPSDCHAKCV